GLLIFHEPMPPARVAGFALVWLALIIFTVDALRKRAAAGPTAATVEPATALPPR
ncbi:MAG TPA: EamA family transporter RarD, partial [Actinoplanes sp.]